MIVKTINYTDYFGVERTEQFFFNLNKVELVELLAEFPGGFKETMLHMADVRDPAKMVAFYKMLISRSYGVKSDDGKRFMKNPEIIASFMESEAYPILFDELANDPKAAGKFLKGIMPASFGQNFEVYDEAEKLSVMSKQERDAALGRMDPDKRRVVIEILKALSARNEESISLVGSSDDQS